MESKVYLERMLGLMCSVFNAYTAVLFHPSDNAKLALCATFSLGNHVRAGTAVSQGMGLVGWIAKNRQPLLINNFDTQRSRLGYYPEKEERTIKAFMGCPVAGGGVLCLDSKRSYTFSEKDQKLLHLFSQLTADIHAQCMESDQHSSEGKFYNSLHILFNLPKKHLRWPDFLTHYLNLVADTTGYEYCFLTVRDGGAAYLLEGTTRHFLHEDAQAAPFDLGGGLLGWVYKNNKPIFCANEDCTAKGSPLFGRDVKTPPFARTICLPVHFQKEVRGVLCLASTAPGEISDGLKNYTAMAGDFLASFLESLYLKSRVETLESGMKLAKSG